MSQTHENAPPAQADQLSEDNQETTGGSASTLRWRERTANMASPSTWATWLTTPAGRARARRASAQTWSAIRVWLAENATTVAWLPARWRSATIAYLLAALLQVVAIAVSFQFARIFPEFRFPDALSYLMLVFVSLNLGAGPGLLATLLGAPLIDYFLLPPYLTWSYINGSDLFGVFVYVVIGISISLLVSAAARARQVAQAEHASAATAFAQARKAQEQMGLANKRLQALQAITDTALAHLEVVELLGDLLNRIREVMGVDNVALLLVTEDGQHLRVYQASGFEEEVVGQVEIPIGEGIAGRIAATRAPLIVDDLSTVEVANLVLRKHASSLAGVPLLVSSGPGGGTDGKRLLGVLHMDSALPAHFNNDDLRFLELVANRVALALDHAALFAAEQRARADAAASANQLASVFATITDGVYVYNASGQLLHSNVAGKSFNPQADSPEYQSRPLAERIAWAAPRDPQGHPLDADELAVSRILRGETLSGSNTIDTVLRGVDGRDILVNVCGAPVRDEDGSIQGAVLVTRDVTERRRLEQRTQDALQALVRMVESLLVEAVKIPVALPTAEAHSDDAENAATSGSGDRSPDRGKLGVVSPEHDAPDSAHQPAPEDGESDRAPDVGTPDVAQIIGRRLVELTQSLLGCQRVGLVAIDPATGTQRPLAVAGIPAESEEGWRAGVAQSRMSDSIAPDLTKRFLAGEVLVVDLTQPPFRDLPNPYGVRTMLAAPLCTGEQVIGTLSYDYGGAEHDYTEDEVALARGVAQLAALTLEWERLKRQNTEAQAQILGLQEAKRRMDAFLVIASHELKTPVTSMKAAVQLTSRAARSLSELTLPERGVAKLARAVEMLDLTDRQATKLGRLVDDLLDVTRLQAGSVAMRLAPADLGALMREAVEQQRLAWPGREIRLDLPDALPTLELDADRVSQVVTNYLTNALKYSAPDTSVTVTAAIEADQRRVRVAVRDCGPGLSAEQRQQLWQLYHRVPGIQQQSGSGAGIGIGLYMCKTIVEQHEGQVGVESKPGEGSTFWFTLPLAGFPEE